MRNAWLAAVAALLVPISVLLAPIATAGERRARSADGVEIAFETRGGAPTAIVFVHGGFADRTFWSGQLERLSSSYRVVALDLAGHGASGTGRQAWTLAAWAADVRAVADALGLQRMVLVGNSLGGPVAVEAARTMRGRVIGVVGVDTFQDLGGKRPPAEQLEARARAFEADFAGACRSMVGQLLHKDVDAAFKADIERRMCSRPAQEAAAMAGGMLRNWIAYDGAAAAKSAEVPIRAINGDLYPVNVERIRGILPGFEAVVLPHTGHYPMLERPQDFDRHLVEAVRAFEKK